MKKKKWNKSRRAFLAFLLPSFLGVVLFVLLPLLDVFKRSFTTAITGEFVGIQNYVTVYENRAFRLAVGTTLRFTLVCLPLLLVLGLLAALLGVCLLWTLRHRDQVARTLAVFRRKSA